MTHHDLLKLVALAFTLDLGASWTYASAHAPSTSTTGIEDRNTAVVPTPDEIPPNDEPCGAIALQIVNGCMPRRYATTGATTSDTTSPGALSVPAPCDGAIPNNDSWFTAIVPPNGQLRLEMEATAMTDAALAIYTAAGSCTEGTLSLTPVACATDGSTYDEAMPLITATGLTPGDKVYIRIWRESGEGGDVLVCAGSTVVLSGCVYHITFNNLQNMGWNNGTFSYSYGFMSTFDQTYTTTMDGSSGYLYFDFPNYMLSHPSFAFIFDIDSIVYNQLKWKVYELSSELYIIDLVGHNSEHTFHFQESFCIPYFEHNDCIGNYDICEDDDLYLAQYDWAPNLIHELINDNAGCIRDTTGNGNWYRITTYGTGSLAFTLTPQDPTIDLNWAIWGPTTEAEQCDLDTLPLRCSYAMASGPTGMSATASDLSENESGDGWLSPIISAPFKHYMLYVEQPGTDELIFTITFQNEPPDLVNCEGLPTGVSQRLERTASLAPNPAHSTLTLQPGHLTPYHWQLIEARGSLVRSGNHTGDLTLSVNDLPKGLYLLRTLGNEGVEQEHRWVKE